MQKSELLHQGDFAMYLKIPGALYFAAPVFVIAFIYAFCYDGFGRCQIERKVITVERIYDYPCARHTRLERDPRIAGGRKSVDTDGRYPHDAADLLR